MVIFIVFAMSPLMGSADDTCRPGDAARPSSITMRIFYLDSILSALFDGSAADQSGQPTDDDRDGDFLIKKARAIPKFVDLVTQISSESRAFSSSISIPAVDFFEGKAVSTFQVAADAVPRTLKGYAASYPGLSPPHFLFS